MEYWWGSRPKARRNAFPEIGPVDGGQGKSFPQIGPTVVSPSFVPLLFGSDDPNIE
jgi:hypothetical protein